MENKDNSKASIDRFVKTDFSFQAKRDPERIDDFLAHLGKCWKKVPEWRFGQLVMNVLGEMQSQGRDPFFPEEPEMLKFIEWYFSNKILGFSDSSENQ